MAQSILVKICQFYRGSNYFSVFLEKITLKLLRAIGLDHEYKKFLAELKGAFEKYRQTSFAENFFASSRRRLELAIVTKVKGEICSELSFSTLALRRIGGKFWKALNRIVSF